MHLCSKADVLCHDGTGNCLIGVNGSSSVLIHVEGRGDGPSCSQRRCSVVETGKGFSQELVENSGGVSIYVEGRGAPGTMGRANCTLVIR